VEWDVKPLHYYYFCALTLLVGSFDPEKPIRDMTCNVFGGMLTQLPANISDDVVVMYLNDVNSL